MTVLDRKKTNGNSKPPYQLIQLPKVPNQCGVIYDAKGQAVGQTGVACPGDIPAGGMPPFIDQPPIRTTPPGTTTPGTAPDLSVDGLLEWVKANPLIAAGIAAAAFFMFKGK